MGTTRPEWIRIPGGGAKTSHSGLEIHRDSHKRPLPGKRETGKAFSGCGGLEKYTENWGPQCRASFSLQGSFADFWGCRGHWGVRPKASKVQNEISQLLMVFGQQISEEEAWIKHTLLSPLTHLCPFWSCVGKEARLLGGGPPKDRPGSPTVSWGWGNKDSQAVEEKPRGTTPKEQRQE